MCLLDCQIQKYVMKDGSLCFKHCTVATWWCIQEYSMSSSMSCTFCSKQFFISFVLFSDDDITLVLVRWNFNDACFHCLAVHFCPVFQPIVRLLANASLLIPRVSTETIVSITKVPASHSTRTLYASTTISSKNENIRARCFNKEDSR